MYIVDLNVLIYTINEDAGQHDQAIAWLESALRDSEEIGLPWVVLLGFIRICTNPRILAKPVSVDEAIEVVRALLRRPGVSIVQPGADHFESLATLLMQSGTAGNLATDAHIAALAVEHDATVVTFDRDFQRFGVKVIVP